MKEIDLDTAMQIGQNCFCFNLRKASRVITQFYENYLRQTGLRVTQFTIMTAVRALAPVTVKQLAQKLKMDRTTLGRNLKPLKSRGFIHIESGTDRRERWVALTPHGHEALLNAHPLWEQAQTDIEQLLGTTRLNELLSGLHYTSAIPDTRTKLTGTDT